MFQVKVIKVRKGRCFR